MIAHYLASALARFRRTPFTTGANILTLALGLACFIAAWGVVSWWSAADHYHPGADRIFVVGQTNRIGQAVQSGSRQAAVPQAISSWNLGPALRADFPDLEQVARVNTELDMPVSAAGGEAILDIAIVDPEFLDVFQFDFIAGDASALSRPGGAVITADAAARLFGGAPALGESVLINGSEEATVTGVIAPVRQPSFMGSGADAPLRFDMIRDWGTTPLGRQLDGLPASWIGIGPYTFVRLPESLAVEDFNARLPAFLDRHVPESEKAVAQITMNAFPVSRLSTFQLDRALLSGSAGLTAVAALLGLAALTLVIACVNYANLATAQAAAHARQIGLRKTLGAGRGQVMLQSLLEAGLLTAAALAVALLALALAAPAISAFAGVETLFFLSRGGAQFAVLAALVLGVTLLAGAYPAFVLSRVRPARALRDGGRRSGPRAAARVLVGVQFASASFLLIMVAVTQLQRGHLERAALTPHADPVVVLNDLMELNVNYQTLMDRLAAQPGVRSATVVDHMPWGNTFNGLFLTRTPDPSAAAYPVFVKNIGYDYFETLDLDLLAGRVFDRAQDTAPTSLFAPSEQPVPAVVDWRYAQTLGFASPQAAVGETIYIPAAMSGGAAQPVEIVGVTETEWTRLGADTGGGQIYTYSPRAFWGLQLPVVRIAREDAPGAMAQVERVWRDVAPGIPLDARFFDSLFEQGFRTHARASQIFMLLAGSAFAIASAGLVGIAVQVTARRRREIGVRKTLGATRGRVLRLLLADFSKPVVVGNLIAWPFAWFAAQAYLQAFADRTPLTPAPFALSLAVTLAIAWLSVGGQAWRAAGLKPALVLRAE